MSSDVFSFLFAGTLSLFGIVVLFFCGRSVRKDERNARAFYEASQVRLPKK